VYKFKYTGKFKFTDIISLFILEARMAQQTRRRRNIKHTRKQRGGVQINLNQLLMTDPIFTAANTIKGSPIDRTPYLKEKGHQGFVLARVNRISEANLDKLEAIDITPKLVNGKSVGRKIEGVSVPLYSIENGRHRVAKALAEGRTSISATIV
jgi:hypothetical protein